MDPMMIATTDQADSISQYHLVIFRLDRQVYGLTIDKVVQIFPMVKITPLPQMSQLVEGVINVRGKVAPVINVRRPLGLSEARLQLYTPIILVQLRGHLVGLIVDEVLDVQSFAADQVVHTSEILPEWMGNLPALDGLVYVDGLTILLINPEHLLQPCQIQAVLQALPDSGGRRWGGANEPGPTTAGANEPAAVVEPVAAIQPEAVRPAAEKKAKGNGSSSSAGTAHKSSRSRGGRKAEDRLAQHFSDLTNDLPPAEV